MKALTSKDVQTTDLSHLKHIFRAYDIRGEYGEQINPMVHYRIGQAFGTYIIRESENGLQNESIYVGYDIRKTSPVLVHAFNAGLMSTGVNITFSGEPVPLGVALFSAQYEKAYACAFVTASHLPPNWNGVKFYHGNGVGFSQESNMKIRDIFLEGKFIKPSYEKIGQCETSCHKKEYIDYLSSKFSFDKKIKVVIDCGNGASVISAPQVLSKAGLTIIPLFCEIDPFFSNRSSEPNEKSLRFLSQKVRAEEADFGVGFDGDGDRAIIVDDKGRVLDADITGLIIANHYISNNLSSKRRVLANVECSLSLEKVLEPKNAIIDRIKVGHTYLTLIARDNPDTLLGMERSGHMVFPELFIFDDAVPIPLFIAKVLSETNHRLSEIVDTLPKTYKAQHVEKCPDNIKFDVIDELVRQFKSRYDNINTIDGLGIRFGDKSWILIRASNTGPKIRITVESDSSEEVENLKNKFVKSLKEIIHQFAHN